MRRTFRKPLALGALCLAVSALAGLPGKGQQAPTRLHEVAMAPLAMDDMVVPRRPSVTPTAAATPTTVAATPAAATPTAAVHSSRPEASRSGTRPRTQAPAPAVAAGACEQRWGALVAQYAWPVGTMLQIMCHQESGGDPNATNPRTRACGLFQLLPCPGGGYDPAYNVKYAYEQKYVPACTEWHGDCLHPWGR